VLLRNLLLSAMTTTLFFLGLETILRVAELAPTRTLAYPDLESWERFPGPFHPGQEFVDRFKPDLAHSVSINSLGFRGPEISAAKPEGTYRVLCLGDSYVFGDYVDDDETFPAALERNLRKTHPDRSIEVVNAGVNGYTITDETAFALEKGLSLDPDALVVVFVLNDLADMTRTVSTRENQRLAAERVSSSALTPLKNLLRKTSTYNLLFMLKASVMGRMRLDPTVQEIPLDHLLHPPFDERTESLFLAYRHELLRLAGACRARGTSLTLVLFPYYEQVARGASVEAQSRMARIAAEARVAVVDLHGSFLRAAARGDRLFMMPHDHHPSATGYRLAARRVGRALSPAVEGRAGGTEEP
jgi:lysophospholipase L1-like esterase